MRYASVLLLLIACDTSEPIPYAPIYDPGERAPLAMAEFCTLLSKNACASLRSCCQDARLGFDEARCRANARGICEAHKSRALEVGLVYDDLQAGRCARGQPVLLRECSTLRAGSDPVAADVAEACTEVFHGLAAAGDPCNSRATKPCAPSDLGERISCEGVCRVHRPASIGESCQFESCVAGLRCLGTPPRCLPSVVPTGSSCATPGVSCDEAQDAYCNPATFTCAQYPSRGESCTSTNACARPYRCDTDKAGGKVCIDGKALGTYCGESKECASRVCGETVRACLPTPFGFPLSGTPTTDPLGYVAGMAASCDGLLAAGGGGLSAVPLPSPPP